MNCSTPGLPVHHQLPEFTQTHVHRVGDAIQQSHPLLSPSPPAPNPSPASESFPMSQHFAWGGRSIGVSALASVLPKNTRDWSPLEWIGWISLQSKGLSRVFSNSKHYPQWWKIESISPKVKNKTKVPIFTTTIQHSFGSFGHSNQSRKRNKRNANWKRRSKTLTVCRWHDPLHRKP